jgi:alpha-tubulin suppressor-like RCC1 family protein
VAGTSGGTCGDGVKQSVEACDHNGSPATACPYGQMSCQVCNSQCKMVAGSTTYCGDGVRQSSETCDGSNLNNATCSGLGAGTGTLSCSNTCAYNTSACMVATGGVVELASGYGHSCARFSNGTVKCWGRNDDGRLGNGTNTDSAYPVLVSGLTDAVQITAGGYHTCARRSNGTISCWGGNLAGQLGTGSTIDSSVPIAVSGITNASSVTAGTSFTCASVIGGSAYCWGENTYGQLADASNFDSTFPSPTSFFNATQMSAGIDHGCALTSNSTAMCWGRNFYGQLGNYLYSSDQNTPVSVVLINGLDLTGLNYIGAGAYSSCARKGNQVYCWGDNSYGQLGVGAATSSTSYPSPLSGAYSFLTVGERHACAIDTLGGLNCWGSNANGRLGIGSFTTQYTPVSVPLPNVVEVQGGGQHTCARTSTGAVYCWGRNGNGQVGDGSLSDRASPTAVIF